MENEPTESGLLYTLFGEDPFEGENAETNHTQRETVETTHTQGGTTVNEFDLNTQPDDYANEETLNEDFNTQVDDTNDTSSNVDTGPQTGMQYATLDNLFDAYQEHARLAGFSVVKRTSRKLGEDEYIYALFVCCKSGKPTSHTASKRVDCKARLNAKRQTDGSWVVSKMVSDHNHDLDPHFSVLMPAHRTLSVHLKRQLEANDIAGIRVSKNIRLLEVQSGGPENLGCFPKDCRNFIDERRRMRLGEDDAEAVRSLFIRLKKTDGNFYYLIDTDDEGRLRNVLCIHPRSRAAYQDFNDVVSFDTTYLVNRHQMPFAAFVGVNHHGHSILLGCALVTHENAASFKWIFSNWLQAMGGIHPTGIITDQCESIKLALRDIMPNTIHRYCIWHIMAKLPVKFRFVPDYNKVINEWKGIVYDSLDVQTFEMKWMEFIVRNHLESNKWLQDLYSERVNWVPIYLNHTFWAGMISTQRSEGMHAYFDEFLHSRCSLVQFMEQYEMAIGSKVRKEFMADCDSKNKIYVCTTQYPWEAQFQKVYTNSMFQRVQAAIERMKYCLVIPDDEESNEVGVQIFKVVERRILNDYFRKDYTYIVSYRSIGEVFNCNCRSFEFKGILCCHIFEVLRTLNVENINDRYILRRWRKDVHRSCSKIFFAGGYPHMTDEYKKFQEVEKYFQECTDLAFGSIEKMNFIKSRCLQMKKELENWNPSMVNNCREPTSTDVEGTRILNPQVTKTKGRPPEKRMKSALERGGRRGRGRTTTVRERGGRIGSGRATSSQPRL